MDGAGCDFDCTAVSSMSSQPWESPLSARNTLAGPAEVTVPEALSAEFTLGSQHLTGVGGKRARRLCRHWESVRGEELTPARR